MIRPLTSSCKLQELGFFSRPAWVVFLAFWLLALLAAVARAHGVAEDDKSFIEQSVGMQIIPFVYLGAKHMVTGYDHLLFLFGVIFFLYRVKDIGISRGCPYLLAGKWFRFTRRGLTI